MLFTEFKNKPPPQERHSELDGPEHVMQVASQFRHFGFGLV